MVAAIGQRDAVVSRRLQAVGGQRAGLGDRSALDGVQGNAVLRAHSADHDVTVAVDVERAAHVEAAVGLRQVVDGQVGGAGGAAQHAAGQGQVGGLHGAVQHQTAAVQIERGAGQIGLAAGAGDGQYAAGQRQLAAAADRQRRQRGVAGVAAGGGVIGDGAGTAADGGGQHVGAVRRDAVDPVAGGAPQAAAAAAPGRQWTRGDGAMEAGAERVIAGVRAGQADRAAAGGDGFVDADVLVGITEAGAFAEEHRHRVERAFRHAQHAGQRGPGQRGADAVVVLAAGQGRRQRGRGDVGAQPGRQIGHHIVAAIGAAQREAGGRHALAGAGVAVVEAAATTGQRDDVAAELSAQCAAGDVQCRQRAVLAGGRVPIQVVHAAVGGHRAAHRQRRRRDLGHQIGRQDQQVVGRIVAAQGQGPQRQVHRFAGTGGLGLERGAAGTGQRHVVAIDGGHRPRAVEREVVDGAVVGAASHAQAADGQAGLVDRAGAADAAIEHVVAVLVVGQRRTGDGDGLAAAGQLVGKAQLTGDAGRVAVHGVAVAEAVGAVGAAQHQIALAVVGLAGAGDGGGDVARRDDQLRRGVVADVVLARIQAADVVGADIDGAVVTQRAADVGRRRITLAEGGRLAIVDLAAAAAGHMHRQRRQEAAQHRQGVAFVEAPRRRIVVDVEAGEAGLLLHLRRVQADGAGAVAGGAGAQEIARHRAAVGAVADQRVHHHGGIGLDVAAAVCGAHRAGIRIATQQAASGAGAAGGLAGHVALHVGVADGAVGIARQAAHVRTIADHVGLDRHAADGAAGIDGTHQRAGIAVALDRGAAQLDVL